MWTHRRPYKRSRLTKESIRYHVVAGLYRALNIGNLVGFIGSGVTIAYGRPTWSELVNGVYQYVKKYYNGNDDEKIKPFAQWVGVSPTAPSEIATFGLDELWRTLASFQDQGGKAAEPDGERLKIILEMCENLARAMDHYARQQGKQCYHAAGLRHHICQSIGRQKKVDPHPDPVAQIYRQLGIRRFLTVNYDIEIERFLRQKEGFSAEPSDGKDIKKLISEPISDMLKDFDPRDPEKARNHPLFLDQANHLRSWDNIGRSIETVRLVESSLSDLITFACFSGAHKSQVFHVHGRLDDPENLLVTEGDYQRVYLRSGVAQRTFEEALDTLFLGNDVLFIGLGMNESDLLRPLRQFVVTDRLADVEARRVFALLPYFGEQNAVQRALDLKIRYGVQTLFFGDGMNWKLRDLLHSIERWLAMVYAGGERENSFNKLQRDIKNTIETIRDRFKSPSNLRDIPIEYRTTWPGINNVFAANYYDILIQKARNSRKKFSQALCAPINDSARDFVLDIFELDFDKQKIDLSDKKKLTEIQKDLRSAVGDLVTRGLCDEIAKIASGWRSWWEDWLVEPCLRRSAYAYLPKSGLMGQHETAVRHLPCYEQGSDKTQSALLQRAIDLMPPLNTLNQRRILRLTSERGAGKGFLFNELHSFGNYKHLIPEQKRKHYKGAYFAQTSFSLEFSSVVASLVRFIASHVATPTDLDRAEPAGADGRTQLQADVVQDPRTYFYRNPQRLRELDDSETPLWPDDEIPNTISRLHEVLRRLKAAESPRLFICLSGLERLCNKEGNAYSAAHRAFFRLLAGPEFESLPIDLVLISGDPDHPIRHLSNVVDDVPQNWQRLPKLPLEQRHWLFSKEGELRRYVNLEDLAHAPILARLMNESVALDSWISLCAAICFSPSDSENIDREKRQADKQTWIQKLEHAAGRSPNSEIISELFSAYREFDLHPAKSGGSPTYQQILSCDLRDLILHHLSFFSLPIEISALLICPDIRRMLVKLQFGEQPQENAQYNEELALGALLENLERLHERGLLMLVYSARAVTHETPQSGLPPFEMELDDKRHFRFALHGRMRQYIARQMRFALPDRGERNYYGVSLYTVQPRDLPTPSEVHFRRVYRIVEELLYSVRRTLQPFYNTEKAGEQMPSAEDLHAMTQRLRAGYSIVREAFSIGSLSRLKRFEGNDDDPGEPYEIYRSLLGAIISAVAGMRYAAPKIQDIVKNSRYEFDEAFYRQEVLWLYNERALTAFVQGRLYDSIPLFNQALRIARSVTDGSDDDDAFRATERRILLNLAIAEIERGNIRLARHMLEELALRKLRTKSSTGSTTKVLAEGYLGLCDHLSGHLHRAEKRYRKVLADAERLESMRTPSIFHRHYADILRLLKRNEEAQSHLQLAKLAAARDEQKDVLQYALIAQARLYRDAGDREALREASRLLDEAERYAKELGLIKLEVEALKARSTIILAQGETEQAGRLVARAAGLANRHGMELHKISCTIIHGRILLERGQVELASAILKECSREADRRGYQLGAIFADRLLRMHGQAQATDELGTLWNKGRAAN
jgi:tetratricopeptide (TPR) repeat protein